MRETKTSAWIGLVTVACALGVAVVDFLIPSYLPWYGLYAIPVIWIALWSAEEDVFPVTALAAVVSLLAVLRGVLAFGPVLPVRLEDRLILIAVVWSTVLLAVLRKRSRRTFRWINLARKKL